MALDPISAFRNTSITASTGKISGLSAGFASMLEQATSASNANTNTATTTTSTTAKSNAQQLEDYVNMTPEQRMRADLLKKLGVTEEELASMPAEERSGIEAKMTEMVQELAQKAAAEQQAGTRRVDTLA